jgi:hypothetical protein
MSKNNVFEEKSEGWEETESWKQLRGTELGGLLSSIYGKSAPLVNYPKITKKKTFEPTGTFSSSGAKVQASTKRNITVAVPKFGQNKSNGRPPIAAVDLIAKRKQESIIRAELDDIKMRNQHYRPAHSHLVGESEKDKLNQINTYKGGKILPPASSYPIGETPLEIAAKIAKEKDEMKYRRNSSNSSSSIRKAPVLSDLELLKEQVADEINERRLHLESMKSLGMLCICI